MKPYAALSIAPLGVYALSLCGLELVGALTSRAALLALPLSSVAVLAAALPWARTTLWPHRARVAFGAQPYRIAVALAPGVVAQLANYRLDQILIAALSGPKQLGFYSVAVSAAEVATLPATARSQILLRDASVWTNAPSLRRSIRLIAPAGLITAIPFLIFLEAFAPAYEPSVLAYLLLLPGSVAIGVTRMIAAVATAKGYGALSSRAALVSLVVGIPLTTAAVLIWGISGAAVAASGTYSLTAVLIAVWWRAASSRVTPSGSGQA
jgi:O-antigen/teichoic acid export membrane protein